MGKKKQQKINDPFADREAEKYEKPIPSREFILGLLKKSKAPVNRKSIAQSLGLSKPEQLEALRRRLNAMVRDQQLVVNRRGFYALLSKLDLITGYVQGHRDGYGFVIPEDGSTDLYLSARQMRAVFPDDKVLVRVVGKDFKGRREASIVEILETNTSKVVGCLMESHGAFHVEPMNEKISQEVIIPPESVGNAKPGDIVVAHILMQPTKQTPPIGEVISILGPQMAPGMEIDVAIFNHNIPHEWPEDVLESVQQYAEEVTESDMKDRTDLRALPFVTIDGEDAKDFDDAVFCKPKEKGGWVLYVAIADVSHYVRPDTPIDKEGYVRGNSVYFPGRVIPMLPELLSNGLCSLNPKVKRLSMVCEMSITQTGKISRFRFYDAVIRSQERLTYSSVYKMLVLEDRKLKRKYKEIFPHLQDLMNLYQVLREARNKRGAIDFDLPDYRIVFGKDKKIERIISVVRNDAHRIIEECMLCANVCAAKFLLKHKSPALYRNHQPPTSDKLLQVREYLSGLSLQLRGGKEPTPKDYVTLVEAIQDRPDAHLIQTVLLRSLSQAVYGPDNIGHFGLAFSHYAHFTSPIRRYPDLLVHRAIREILQGKESFSKEEHEQFVIFGEHCSMTERRADNATREVIDWLKCEFMLDKLGEEFEGVVVSATSFGLFIELKQVFVEGLLHVTALPNDYYHYNPSRHALVGEHTSTVYGLGDELKVRVAKVDLDSRRIDFILAKDGHS